MPCPYITNDILYIHHITALRKQYNFLIVGKQLSVAA